MKDLYPLGIVVLCLGLIAAFVFFVSQVTP